VTKDERRELFNSVFNTPQGKEVLEDLSRFCEFKHSSFNADGMIMANREGKKEPYRYIQKQLEAK
jgi:hypothetical protein